MASCSRRVCKIDTPIIKTECYDKMKRKRKKKLAKKVRMLLFSHHEWKSRKTCSLPLWHPMEYRIMRELFSNSKLECDCPKKKIRSFFSSLNSNLITFPNFNACSSISFLPLDVTGEKTTVLIFFFSL